MPCRAAVDPKIKSLLARQTGPNGPEILAQRSSPHMRPQAEPSMLSVVIANRRPHLRETLKPSSRLRVGIVRVLKVTGIVAQQFEMLWAPVIVGVVATVRHEAQVVFARVVI